ncbi:MAG: hypothetical protein KAT48_13765 [Bacteroidales bacterium]|nr:hypothetical protein [Bacteroidales bacterium]
MKKSDNPQQLFFQQIRMKIPPDLSFVHQISELLGISYDSAYRRIRGEKEITMDELQQLSLHFGVSIDTLFSVQSDNVIFTSKALDKDNFRYDQWLGSILENIKKIHGAKEKKVIYSAKDIPIFHYFQFPEIAAFKEFIWFKTLLQFPEYEDKLFSLDNASREAYKIGREILTFSLSVPTDEIWNEETFNSLIRQMEYYWVSGYFAHDEDFLLLLEKLELLLRHLKQQAEYGFKFPFGQEPKGIEGSFQFFYNDFILGENTILFDMDGTKISFLTCNVLNLLITTDPVFCKQVENYMNSIIKKSILISSVSEKERNRFFNKLAKKIDSLKDRISYPRIISY